MPLLADRYRILRPDLRGHGQSFDPGPDYRWSIEDLIADTLTLMDTLCLDCVHFVGESAGGVLGLALAARHPDRLLSVTTCSTPAAIPRDNLDRLVTNTGFATMEEALQGMSLSDWTRAQFASRGLTKLSDAHADWVVEEWSKNRLHVLSGIMAMLPAIDLRPELPGIAIPTLFLAPTNSPLTDLREQQVMAELIPGAQWVAIDGSAHEIYVDRPEECVEALRNRMEHR